MITKQFPDLFQAWRGLTEELAYGTNIKPLKWGVCVGYPDLITVEIENALLDGGMHLGMASFTKSRWTRFLRRYFRADFPGWVTETMEKLNRYPSRPFVASYAPNLDTGHNYGGCLSSVQIRIRPEPRVVLYSRACQIDKIGFLDMALIHIIAKMMGVPEVKATWVISTGFISAISQIYYVKRFGLPLEDHRLIRTLGRLNTTDYDSIKFGPLKRGRKRMMALDEFGEIPRSCFVSELSIESEVFKI